MFDIAIVEDERLERKALRKILETKLEGVRIVGEARNGTEAVDLIDTRHIDLMLVDIRIPRPNGLEIIQILRDRDLATKAIILTAYDHFDIMKEAINLKADKFLLKPVRTEELLKAVRACLSDLAPDDEGTADDLAERIADMAERGAYRDCLTLVRHQITEIFADGSTLQRQAVRTLLDSLAEACRTLGQDIPKALSDKAEHVKAGNLSSGSHQHLQETSFQIVDVAFAVTDRFGANAADHIDDVLNYIERNLHNSVHLEDAADFARISPCYLSRLFRKEMETTFISYVTAQRIDRAKELLRSNDLPVSTVAFDLCFKDANYFCKSFKKHTGLSPSEYRRKHTA